MFKNSDDAEYLLNKMFESGEFFGKHPCRIRPIIGERKCEEGMCPFALSDDYCAALALRSGGLEYCKEVEKTGKE